MRAMCTSDGAECVGPVRNQRHRQRRHEVCEATGKRKYFSREEAAAGMGLLHRRTGDLGLSAYRCLECGEHHVGHMPKQVIARFGLA